MSVAEKGQKAKEVPSRAREKSPNSCLAFRHIFESVVTHWCEIPEARLPLSLGLFLTYFYLSHIWQSEFFKNTPLPILNNYFKKTKILKKNMKYMREGFRGRLPRGICASHIRRSDYRKFSYLDMRERACYNRKVDFCSAFRRRSLAFR